MKKKIQIPHTTTLSLLLEDGNKVVVFSSFPGETKDAESWAREEMGERGRELQRLMGGCSALLPAFLGVASVSFLKAGESSKLTENPEPRDLRS